VVPHDSSENFFGNVRLPGHPVRGATDNETIYQSFFLFSPLPYAERRIEDTSAAQLLPFEDVSRVTLVGNGITLRLSLFDHSPTHYSPTHI